MDSAEVRAYVRCPTAFWLAPDWSGGDNLRDPGTSPFWMKPVALPLAAPVPAIPQAPRPIETDEPTLAELEAIIERRMNEERIWR